MINTENLNQNGIKMATTPKKVRWEVGDLLFTDIKMSKFHKISRNSVKQNANIIFFCIENVHVNFELAGSLVCSSTTNGSIQKEGNSTRRRWFLAVQCTLGCSVFFFYFRSHDFIKYIKLLFKKYRLKKR